MAIIDEYIGRIDRCLSTPDIEEAGDLVEEIVATFIGPDPDIKKGLDRYKARAVALGSTPNFDNAGDLRKLKGKLSVLREKEAREATSDPARLALGTIDAHLAECRKLAASGDEKSSRAFVDDMVCVPKRHRAYSRRHQRIRLHAGQPRRGGSQAHRETSPPLQSETCGRFGENASKLPECPGELDIAKQRRKHDNAQPNRQGRPIHPKQHLERRDEKRAQGASLRPRVKQERL